MFRRAQLLLVTMSLMVCMFLGTYAVSQAASVSFWTQQATNPALLNVLAEFTKETGIAVEIKALDWGTDTMFVALAAGAAPDLFTHGAAALATFAPYLSPIDSVLAKWSFLGDMVPAVRAAGEFEGKQLAMPWNGIDIRDLIYQVDALDAAGLDTKRLALSWEGFVQDARKLVQRDADGTLKRSAIALTKSGTGANQFWQMFQRQLGGDLLKDGKPQLNDGTAVQALQFFVDLIHVYRLDDITFSGSIATGTSVMSWSNWGATKTLIDKGVEIGISTFPYKKQPSTFLAANWAAIPTTAKNPAGAARLMEYLVHPERQQILNQQGGGAVPFYRSAARWDWVKTSPQLLHLIQATSYAMAAQPHARYIELRDEMIKYVVGALKQEYSPETAMAQAQDALMRIVSEGVAKK